MIENYYTIAAVLEAIKIKFGQQSGETPVRSISPAEFRELCAAHGVEADTARDIYTIAIALVQGMLQAREGIALVGGGELIVQVEDLGSLIASSFREAIGNQGNLIEVEVGTVNPKTGETVNKETLLVNVKE